MKLKLLQMGKEMRRRLIMLVLTFLLPKFSSINHHNRLYVSLGECIRQH